MRRKSEAFSRSIMASAADVTDIRSVRGCCDGCGVCCGRVLPLSAFDIARLKAYVERNRIETSPDA